MILKDWKWKIRTNDLRDPQPIMLFLKINTCILTILRNGNRKQKATVRLPKTSIVATYIYLYGWISGMV